MANNKLSIRADSNFGKKLVEQAVEEYKEAAVKQVVGVVQEILVYIDREKENIETSQENISVLEAKVKALEKGEFKLSKFGVITFEDEKLQKAVNKGAGSCPNCGYGNSGVKPGVR